MKKRALMLLVLVFCLLALSSFSTKAADKVIHWKMQAAYPIGTSVTMHAVEWAKAIETLTNGKLKVEILQPGAMCEVKDIVAFLEKNVFDCSVTFGGYYTGFIPETDLQIGLPLGHRTWDEYWDAFYNRGLGEIIQEAYSEHNIKIYPAAADNYYHFSTNFPVNNLGDLRGKKIRAVGVYGKYAQKLGCSVVVIPGAEMYMAMKLGTIDGSIYGATGLEDIKLREVAKYYTLPTAAQIATSLLINEKSLKKLPPELRTIVEMGTKYILEETSNRYITECKNALNKSVRMGLVQVCNLSEGDLKMMRSLVKPLWEELAEKSPRMRKGVEILKQQMRDVGRPMD
jgi:TRAP-type C4-dicarboxylate transport system substrate-binding protein